jgi:hypothetical protein
MGYITKTEAVNQMLLASGENIINDLTDDGSIDTSVAEKILDNVTLEWQLRGISENTSEKYYMPDSVTRRIDLPNTCIHAELLSTHNTPSDPNGRPIQKIMGIIRDVADPGGTYTPILFNITETTDMWLDPPGGQKYRVLERQVLDWGDMNTVTQQSITDSAARMYQIYTQGDANVDKALAAREMTSRMRARAGDIYTKNRNIFVGGDQSVARARDRYHWNSRTNRRIY